jgi:hypothetical protein
MDGWMDGWMVGWLVGCKCGRPRGCPCLRHDDGGVEVQLRIFLTCVLDGGERSTLHPGKEPR